MDEATSNTSLTVVNLSSTGSKYCVNVVAPVYHFLQWVNSPNDNDLKVSGIEILKSIYVPALPDETIEEHFYDVVLSESRKLYRQLVGKHDWSEVRAASLLPMCIMIKWTEIGNINAAYSRHAALERSTPGIAELTTKFKEAINNADKT